MIEIKNKTLIIDGKSAPIKDVNMIQSAKGKLYFSNKFVEVSKNSYEINDVYKILKNVGITNFVLVDKVIVNAENIKSLYIQYYQYAGLSIFQCDKANAEMCMLCINCKNGRSETISFSSAKEAEKCYHILDNAVADIKSSQIYNNQEQ